VSAVHPAAVFIGPMGAGKTRIGKRVARLLGAGFTDTDKVVVAAHGPIPEIFETHGEAHFRRLEREAVAAALATDHVVSLGGGAVLDSATQSDLGELPVVYLTVTAETVAPRLADGNRPLVKDGIESWQRIFDARRPIYERLAHLTVATDGRRNDDIAQEVAAWLQTP